MAGAHSEAILIDAGPGAGFRLSKGIAATMRQRDKLLHTASDAIWS
ncbi:hypothetical protein CBM2617_B140002 [Cupriavidus taiwanensis]|nr:hypothetical protein CBM2617_B140002 [Cupriavidus taiwanensis]SOZ94104.1 hypothetical protein CBM2621_B150002 [Cupriavidus taiwanensis]